MTEPFIEFSALDSSDRYKLVSSDEMRALDEATISGGIPGLELMERAGEAFFRAITTDFDLKDKTTCIFCGSGNNGGDGLVLFRLLRAAGYAVSLVIGSFTQYSSEFQANLQKLENFNSDILVLGDGGSLETHSYKSIDKNELLSAIKGTGIVIDAILGTGSKGALRGAVKDLVDSISSICSSDLNVKVIALDLPTGVDADSGELAQGNVRADVTYCVELVKRGLAQYPAREACGVIKALSIGIQTEGSSRYRALVADNVPFIPERPADAHKGLFGRVLVIAGSMSMPGAADLCSLAALRVGAGLVYRCQLEGVPHYSNPEIINVFLPTENESVTFDKLSFEQLKQGGLQQYDSVVIGPGLGSSAEAMEFVNLVVSHLLESSSKLVLDADGLNALSSSNFDFEKFSLENCVITPHPGEAARLLNTATSRVQANRYRAVEDLVSLSGSTVLLKGASTIVSNSVEGVVSLGANPFLSTAGAGDVLAGIIAGLIAQGLGTMEASSLGVAIHLEASTMSQSSSRATIIASDIISKVPEARALWQL